ncbi:unnamed protein product [Spirodela intermedia]|uniref:Uncharacterized protein n=1 Tax=Spirodela intermedia TaxID=51605 RepID=A0A7I8JNA9_SPIIN|nr:unnamed protein product [Spirodela intermedia]CAA6671636.1 unnamed protein product [Spirodela intermedia]
MRKLIQLKKLGVHVKNGIRTHALSDHFIIYKSTNGPLLPIPIPDLSSCTIFAQEETEGRRRRRRRDSDDWREVPPPTSSPPLLRSPIVRSVGKLSVPRPQFLRYNPDRVREIYNRRERESDGVVGSSSVRFESVEEDDVGEEEGASYCHLLWKIPLLLGILLSVSGYISSMNSSSTTSSSQDLKIQDALHGTVRKFESNMVNFGRDMNSSNSNGPTAEENGKNHSKLDHPEKSDEYVGRKLQSEGKRASQGAIDLSVEADKSNSMESRDETETEDVEAEYRRRLAADRESSEADLAVSPAGPSHDQEEEDGSSEQVIEKPMAGAQGANLLSFREMNSVAGLSTALTLAASIIFKLFRGRFPRERAEPPFESIEEKLSGSSTVADDSKGIYKTNPPIVELLGEFSLEEVGLSKTEGSSSAKSLIRGNPQPLRRISFPSGEENGQPRSEFSTAESTPRRRSDPKDGEVTTALTPLRRSNRIRSRVVSP